MRLPEIVLYLKDLERRVRSEPINDDVRTIGAMRRQLVNLTGRPETYRNWLGRVEALERDLAQIQADKAGNVPAPVKRAPGRPRNAGPPPAYDPVRAKTYQDRYRLERAEQAERDRLAEIEREATDPAYKALRMAERAEAKRARNVAARRKKRQRNAKRRLDYRRSVESEARQVTSSEAQLIAESPLLQDQESAESPGA